MVRKRVRLLPVYLLLLLAACKAPYESTSVQYKDYKINQKLPVNAQITALLQPYADSVNHSMNDVIAVAAANLEKKQPEGALGNVLADAMLTMSAKSFQTRVDVAFINYGGIRIPNLAAGNITRGKVFEITPFDNMIVLQNVPGSVLKQFLDFVAEKGGWPCAGLSFQIQNKKAVNIVVGGKPLSESATYAVVNTDYIVNGGDDCQILKPIPQQSKGYIFRDAVLDYFTQLNKQGKSVTGSIEKRISYAN